MRGGVSLLQTFSQLADQWKSGDGALGGGTLRTIAWTQVVVIVALLVVAGIALLVHDQSVADTIIGGVFGVLVGAGATTVVVQQSMARTAANGNGDPPKAP